MLRLGENTAQSAAEKLVEELVRKYEPERSPRQEMAFTTAQLVEKVIEFLRGLGLSVEDAGRIIHKRPQILQLSLKEQALPLIQFLSTELGLTDAQIRRVVRHAPQIFEQTIALLRQNASYLTWRGRRKRPTSRALDDDDEIASQFGSTTETLVPDGHVPDETFHDNSEERDAVRPGSELDTPAFSPRQLARAVAKRPPILWHPRTSIATMVCFVRDQVGCNARETAHVLSRVPQLLLRSPASLASQIHWLDRQLQPVAAEESGSPKHARATRRRDVARLVVRFPPALILDTEETMQPRIDYLRMQFGVSDMRRCLLNTPTVLEASLDKDLGAFRSILIDIVGFQHDDPALSAFATHVPQFFQTRPHLLFGFLTSEGGLSPADARRCMAYVPSLLPLTGRHGQPEPDLGLRLLPHLQFCRQVLGQSLADVLQAVPGFLGKDLERHLIPRYAFAKSQLTPAQWRSLDLAAVFGSSTEHFCERVVRVPPSEYRSYVQSGKWLLFYTQIL
ncbi:hypothetical protein CCYA_CCYA18G4460 [Cyanidiococcus yangmingshanensis]|nr:hypothetical protein CCYA_CCYA18G4460 [Cyanidiococcus yangmingshanensis]